MPQNSLIDPPTDSESQQDEQFPAADLDCDAPIKNSRLLSELPMAVVWALVAQGIFSVTRLLASMTVGGRFGPGSEEQLGYYSSAFGILMILIGIHEALVTTPLTVFNQKVAETDRRRLSASALVFSLLVAALVLAGTGILFIVQVGTNVLPGNVGLALLVVCALAPLQLLREFSRRWLLANLAVKASALMECVFAAMFLISLMTLVATSNVSAVSVFIAIGCVNVVGLCVWWFIYREQFQFSRTAAVSQMRENFRYGRWVAGENFCSTVIMYACVWILMFMLGEASAGVFFACFTIVMLANPFLLGVSSLLAPRAAQEFVNNGWPGLRRVLLRYGAFITVVLIGFAGFLLVFGEALTELFFSSKYSEFFQEHYNGRNWVTATLGLAMPLLGVSFVATNGLLAINRPNDSFIASIVGLFVLIGANLSFPEPSLQTAAISFVVSVAAGMVCRLVFLIRAYQIATKAQLAP